MYVKMLVGMFALAKICVKMFGRAASSGVSKVVY